MSAFRIQPELSSPVSTQTCRFRHIFPLERPAVALSILAVIAAVPRLFLIWTRSVLVWPDSIGYYNAARSMLETKVLVSPHIFHAPLYPIFLAPFIRHNHGPEAGFAIVCVQHLLGMGLVFMCYAVARTVFNPLVAFCSAALLALHTLLLTYECVIQTEVLFTFLLTLTVLLGLRALRNGSLLTYALVGISCAASALTRPVAQQCLSCIVLLVLLHVRDWRRWITICVVVAGSYFAAVSPWMYLNHKVYGFWGLSHGEGLNLALRVFDLDGLAPVQDSHYPEIRKIQRSIAIGGHKSAYRLARRLKEDLGYSQIEADYAMFQLAFETLRAHPLAYARGSLKDFYLLFFNARNSVTECPPKVGSFGCVHEHRTPAELSTYGSREVYEPMSEVYRSAATMNLFQGGTILLSFAGMLAFFLRKPARGGEWIFGALLCAMIFYFAAVTVAFDTSHDRYRLPIDPYLAMFAAFGLQTITGAVLRAVGVRSLESAQEALPPQTRGCPEVVHAFPSKIRKSGTGL